MKNTILCCLLSALLIMIQLSGCGGSSNSYSDNNDTVKIQMGGAIQGTPHPINNVVTTLAGSSKSMDGIGTTASFSDPNAITTDGTNLYVADTNNNTIRKIVISTGEVSTLAGVAGPDGSADGIGSAASFCRPGGITTDGTNLYVVDSGNFTIRKVAISTGEVTTLAGTAGGFGTTDGIGSSAKFYSPKGITTDGLNLYVTDYLTVRKIIISTGSVTTLAGTALSFGTADGTGSTARFNGIQGISIDGINLYVTDTDNHTIRKIVISTGVVTTIAGSAGIVGSIDGNSTEARFSSPRGIISDGSNLYVVDFFNNNIRKIEIVTGIVTTLAGSAGAPGSSDGTGVTAQFYYPQGITASGANLFVADSGNNTIRKIISSSGVVTTLAGSPLNSSGSADGVGHSARFDYPQGVTTDGTSIFVTEYGNDIIRKITIATGEVTTIAGTAGNWGSADGTGSEASFCSPLGITTDGKNLYVVDSRNKTIRKIVIATGVVTTIAGSANEQAYVDGIGSAARFDNPTGITTDGTNLYVTEYSKNTIRKIIISTGEVSTIAGTVDVTGSTDGTGATASFNAPQRITTDGINLYLTESGNSTIRKIVISTAEVKTIAGSANVRGSADGIGVAASFFIPDGITTDGTNLYISDSGNNTIRKMVISTGVVTTLAGSATKWGAADGTGLSTSFYGPADITSDGTNLYIADCSNNTIRKIH